MMPKRAETLETDSTSKNREKQKITAKMGHDPPVENGFIRFSSSILFLP